jgi:hypothetical protein
MLTRHFFGEDGTSAPEMTSAFVAIPALMLCPIFLSPAATTHEAVQELYRLAYEKAKAAFRPSRYERAQRLCWN